MLIILTGLIGSVIGWITNVIAIKLLFRPYQPIKVPLINLQLQGAIPKRKSEIAAAIGRLVSSELLTGQDLTETLARTEVRKKVTQKAEVIVTDGIEARLPNFFPRTLQRSISVYFAREIGSHISTALKQPHNVFDTIDKESIRSEMFRVVRQKVIEYDMQQLEKMVRDLASREIKHIEIFGAILGFIIGALQGSLFHWYIY